MDVFEVFEKKAQEIVNEKRQSERERFRELKRPFLALRQELEEALTRYYEERPKALEFLNRIIGMPWQELGFFNPPGHVLTYARELNALINCNGKPLEDLIEKIDSLSSGDFSNGQASPIPLTIRDLVPKLTPYAGDMVRFRDVLKQELEKYAGRIEAGKEFVDIKIVALAPPPSDPPSTPKIRKDYRVLE